MNHRHLFGFAIGAFILGAFYIAAGVVLCFSGQSVFGSEATQKGIPFMAAAMLAAWTARVVKDQADRIAALERRLTERDGPAAPPTVS